MDRQQSTTYSFSKRIGFHYFPDTLHYREIDLKHWLPELQSLHTSWVLLQAPFDRAIPEHFIQGLLQNNIEPILHIYLPLDTTPEFDADPLFNAYAHWGVKNIIFFDRPNNRSVWSSSTWAHKNLVDRFIDRFVPLAELAVQNGLTPFFPPLQPGGDYWDTVFLRSALEKMKIRNEGFTEHIGLSAYAWTGNHPLNWGAGGPDRFPKSRPYTPPDEQDHRGFRIFDWYEAISKNALGKALPILLLGAGLNQAPEEVNDPRYFQETMPRTVLSIARLMAGEMVEDINNSQVILERVTSPIKACFFWILATSSDDAFYQQAWFQGEVNPMHVVKVFRKWAENALHKEKQSQPPRKHQEPVLKAQSTSAPASFSPPIDEAMPKAPAFSPLPKEPVQDPVPQVSPAQNEVSPPSTGQISGSTPFNQAKGNFRRPIEHYLLLPLYEWGVADWHLEVIRPFVKKYRPTVGFSLREAALANKVTIIGNTQTFSEEIIERLRAAGCNVERISGDGTSIANQLAMR